MTSFGVRGVEKEQRIDTLSSCQLNEILKVYYGIYKKIGLHGGILVTNL